MNICQIYFSSSFPYFSIMFIIKFNYSTSHLNHQFAFLFFCFIKRLLLNMIAQRLSRNCFRFADLAKTEQVLKEPSFLKMVEGYFNKAATVAGLEEDRINFLKSPEYSLKFNLPYITGIYFFIKILD